MGLFDSVVIVAGIMVASGIFIVSAEIARQVGSPAWLLVVWGVTGRLTVAGALSYGELAAMLPQAGGMYVYLREAFPAVSESHYLVAPVHLGAGYAVSFSTAQAMAIGVILLICRIDNYGVEWGKIAQNVFTVAKLTEGL